MEKRRNSFFENKAMYFILCIMIPSAIIVVTEITPKTIDAILFLLIMFVLYTITLKMIWPILNLKKELSEINLKLEENKNKSALMEEIENKELKDLHRIFQLYKKNLKFVEEEKEDGEFERTYYTMNDSSIYLDEENLIHKNVSMKVINHITQALTGIGIFGTFLGIINGLSNLKLDDSEAMKIGIETLINGVKFSFATSLYGIMLSVILIFIIKIVMDFTMKEANKLSDYMNELIPLYEEKSGFEEIEIQLKKQTSIYEKLASDVAEEMGRKFNDSLKENIEKLTGDFGKFINEMNEKLVSSIADNNSKSFIQLNETMRNVSDKLEIAIDNINNNQESNIGKFMQESISSIKDAINIGTTNEITKLKETMEVVSSKNSELVESFSASMENMKNLTLHQENLLKNTNSSTESINLTTDNMKDLQVELKEVLANFKDFNANNSVSVENIQKTIEEIKDSMRKQLEVNKGLDAMLDKSHRVNVIQDNYVEKLSSISELMFRNGSSFESNMDKINKDIAEYKGSFEYIKNSVIELSKSIEGQSREYLLDLDKANKDVRNTLETVDSKVLVRVNEVSNTLNLVVADLEKNNKKVNEITERIEKFTVAERASQELWVRYESSFNTLNTNITEGIENYNKLISQGTSELFNQYDNRIASAVNELGKIIESLAENTEDIAEALEPVERFIKNSSKNTLEVN